MHAEAGCVGVDPGLGVWGWILVWVCGGGFWSGCVGVDPGLGVRGWILVWMCEVVGCVGVDSGLGV